jgi:hypothetical protein
MPWFPNKPSGRASCLPWSCRRQRLVQAEELDCGVVHVRNYVIRYDGHELREKGDAAIWLLDGLARALERTE